MITEVIVRKIQQLDTGRTEAYMRRDRARKAVVAYVEAGQVPSCKWDITPEMIAGQVQKLDINTSIEIGYWQFTGEMVVAEIKKLEVVERGEELGRDGTREKIM